MDVRLFLFALVGVLVQTLVTAQCREGWVHYGQSCYFANPERMNWYQAKVMCDLVGGHLAVIETAVENIFLTGLLRTKRLESAWTGLEDIVVEGKFVWVTNQEVAMYTNWHPVQPDNKDGNEDCGELYNTDYGTTKLVQVAPCRPSAKLKTQPREAQMLVSFSEFDEEVS